MRFFVGLHQPSDAKRFESAFISVNRIRNRKSAFEVNDWIMDSGAFTEISTHGKYRTSAREYAADVRRWSSNGSMLAAVSQDWMCEPWILQKTGLTVDRHQRLTVDRYDEIMQADPGAYLMPVLQGFAPEEYVRHVDLYGDRLSRGQWVGVGSVCKRNASPWSIVAVLKAIKDHRPDLRLHGFGLKTTALAHDFVWSALHSADSMAWSYAARMAGRNGNDWREAKRFASQIETSPRQVPLWT